MPNYNYTLIILATIVGFFTLAAILLVPVYRFLRKEEKISAEWTEDNLEIEVLKESDKS